MSRNKSLRKSLKQQASSKKLGSLFRGNYWQITASLGGLAITGYLLLAALGGKSGVASKARALLDFASEGTGSGSESGFTQSKRNDRGDSDLHTH